MWRKIREISYDSAVFDGRGFDARYSTDTGGFEPLNSERLRTGFRVDRKRLRRERPWGPLIGPAVEAAVVAIATGSRYLLIGADRGTNEGNSVRVGDMEVNHQYMKSYGLEREFDAFVARYLHPELRYASLLMPLCELQIVRILARHPEYLPAIRSCNRRRPGRPWCLECPKCAWVYLLLSAFVDQEVVEGLFSKDLLADPEFVTTYHELCGRSGHKPFECVGTSQEALLALHLAAERRTSPLHPRLVDIVPSFAEAEALEAPVMGTFNDEHGLPPAWDERIRAMV